MRPLEEFLAKLSISYSECRDTLENRTDGVSVTTTVDFTLERLTKESGQHAKQVGQYAWRVVRFVWITEHVGLSTKPFGGR